MNTPNAAKDENLGLPIKGAIPPIVARESEIRKNREANLRDHELQRANTETRSNAAILESEINYRRLFEAARDGILILDVEKGCITDVNPFLVKLLGFSRNEMMGKTVGELSPFMDIEANEMMLEKLQKHGYVRYEDLPLKTKGGLKVAVEFVSNVYQAGNKRVIQCNIRDITERRQLEAQLIEAQKMEAVGQLAGGIAHDFNNMLSVIMGYSDMIKMGLPADSPLQKHNDQIKHASERAAGLTRQLLVFSRKETVEAVVLNLNVVVTDMEAMLRRLIDENIELTIVPGAGLGHIKADGGYIGQVLMNLVVNARDAMPNGGKITVGTHNVTLDANYVFSHPGVNPGEYVMLSVGDTGTGMTDAVKAHIFEPFFTTKHLGKGTGLGLATCQTIAKQMGGHIALYSEVGEGTTFKVYFPQIEHSVESPVKAAPGGPMARGTEVVLVVEDEPTVRRLAASVLQSLGYEVLSAPNGQEGLNAARDHKGAPISLVITDVIMPRMGGKVMSEWMKATYPDVKILFTSGYTDDTIVRHGILEPGVAFLPKPYTPATLAAKVREVLDAPAT